MPNWCYSRLTVVGNIVQRIKFLNDVTVSNLLDETEYVDRKVQLAQSIVPMPPALEGTRSPAPTEPVNKRFGELLQAGEISEQQYQEYMTEHAVAWQKAQWARTTTGFDNWYDWCNEFWGTKWGDCNSSVLTHDEQETVITFETAWCPFDDSFMDRLGQRWPSLLFYTTSTEESRAYVAFHAVKGDRSVCASSDIPSPPDHIWEIEDEDQKYAEIDVWNDDWENQWFDSQLQIMHDELEEGPVYVSSSKSDGS